MGLNWGGAADMLEKVNARYSAEAHDESMTRMRSDLELQKMKAAEDYRRAGKNQDRTEMVSRVDAAMGGLIGSSIDKKYASSDAAAADAAAGNTDAPLTPEQTDAIAQSKGIDRDAMKNDSNIRLRAGALTGDVDMVHVMQLDKQEKANQIAASSLAQKEGRDAMWAENESKKRDNDARRIEWLIGSRAGGGGKADHFDEKQEERFKASNDRWLAAKFVTKDDSGKTVPDTEIASKLSVLTDKYARPLGYQNASSFVREFAVRLGPDVLRKADLGDIEQWAESFRSSAAKGARSSEDAKAATPSENKSQPSVDLTGFDDMPSAPQREAGGILARTRHMAESGSIQRQLAEGSRKTIEAKIRSNMPLSTSEREKANLLGIE